MIRLRLPGPIATPLWFLLIGGAFAMSPAARATGYTWSNVEIRGGGYIDGLLSHPADASLLYARSDVAGLFRWDESAARWISLSDWFTTAEENLSGCDGFAIDPTQPDVIYAALGRYAAVSPSGLYKSTDRGASWTCVLAKPVGANTTARWHGEPIAVMPSAPRIVLFGTRTDGLWRSTDAGTTWARIATVPAGNVGKASDYWSNPPVGIRTVATAGSTAYVGILGVGVYRSTDAGVTWSALAGAPTNPARLVAAASGRLFVTHANGVARFDPANAAWTNITPAQQTGQDFCAIALDPANENRIVVSRYEYWFNLPLYRSDNAGATWSESLTTTAPVSGAPEWLPADHRFAATATLLFDRATPGALLAGDWYSVWRTSDIAPGSGVPSWQARNTGLETTVNLFVSAPPAGVPLVSGMADIGGFLHTDIRQSPASQIAGGGFAGGYAFDFCESIPAHFSLLTATDWKGTNSVLRTSADGGGSWTVRALPASTKLGRIAIHSGDPSRLVYLLFNSSSVFTSDNNGGTWTTRAALPGPALTVDSIFDPTQPLIADRNQPGRFYLYRNGIIYRSDDSGAIWTRTNATATALPGGSLVLATPPGVPGQLWIAAGWHGLRRSINSGTTFSALGNFSVARAVGFGKPAAPDSPPVVYVFGQRFGTWGVYRSADLGTTWDALPASGYGFGDNIQTLAADRQTYGRVYLGTNGRGIRVGEFPPARVPLETWRAARFTLAQLADPAVGGLLADPDGDSLPNLLEYALASEPFTAGTENLPDGVFDPVTSSLGFTFLRARAELTYIVESSADLQSWTVIATNPGNLSATEPVLVTVPSTPLASCRYLRLRITEP